MELSCKKEKRGKIIMLAAIGIMTLFPVILSAYTHITTGSKEASDVVKLLLSGFKESGFLFTETVDTTLYFVFFGYGNAMLGMAHIFVCMTFALIILYLAAINRKKSMIPLTVMYVILALISINALFTNAALSGSAGTIFPYNRLSLIGFCLRIGYGYTPVIIYSLLLAAYLFFVLREIKDRQSTGFQENSV